MLTKERIDQFYRDVEALGLKRPVATIAEKTGVSKGNVSSYLNRRLSPSENFLNKFYESFKIEPKADASAAEKNVSPAVNDDYLALVKLMVADLRKLNKQKEADLKTYRSAIEKITLIDNDVSGLKATAHDLSKRVAALETNDRAIREFVAETFEKVLKEESKQSLLARMGNKMVEQMKKDQKKDTQPG